LAAHPDVDQALVKEIHYFDLWADRGHAWYRRHFPLRTAQGRITGEASPMYMVHPYAMQRIAFDLPHVKIVVILRDPVSRLVSHYRHSVKLGDEHLSLDAALRAEDERVALDLKTLAHDPFHPAHTFMRFNYTQRSLYHDQVKRIKELFPGRSFFLRLEDLAAGQSLRPLCDFLGIRYDPHLSIEAHNVNMDSHNPAEGLIPADVLDQLRADAELTCKLLQWTPWRCESSVTGTR
jgi:hypothetical protein